ncbi:monovalent cation/H+ antiporter complex subunit F [Amycolatopsis circi]|uniref:monovalent cation/H+ antiporter complex subunit F n=1 Tax=Amycolatopsis circi TaxID=871959 RepID=UPI000E288DEE|nr:monovalent cation/H+ antiporter complex subunit F [Amycolatopsis circi]
MTWLLLAALLLMAGGLGTALWLAARGTAIDRLVGMQFAGTVTVLTLLLLVQAYGPSSAIILPLTLTVLAFAGTLVFARLLGTR